MDTPGVESIAKLWQHGPNRERIARLMARFGEFGPRERQLFLLGLDIEEGVLPLVHPGGRVSRRNVVNDDRLIAGGGLFDYRLIARAGGEAAAPASSTAPDTSGAEAADTACTARTVVLPAARKIQDVLAEDDLAMSACFGQWVLRRTGRPGEWMWQGMVRPLNFFPDVYEMAAVYDADPMAPLGMIVVRPDLHPKVPHRYELRRLCTFWAPLGSWLRGRDGDDLVMLLRFAMVWLVRYRCWLSFDEWWPGPNIPHDPIFLTTHLGPNDLCPFHPPNQWGSCCRGEHLRRAEQQRRHRDGVLRAG